MTKIDLRDYCRGLLNTEVTRFPASDELRREVLEITGEREDQVPVDVYRLISHVEANIGFDEDAAQEADDEGDEAEADRLYARAERLYVALHNLYESQR